MQQAWESNVMPAEVVTFRSEVYPCSKTSALCTPWTLALGLQTVVPIATDNPS